MTRINNLKAIRERAGLTQVQVAGAVGVTEPMYQRYEYGKSAPSIWTAIRISRALGVAVEDIWDF